MRLEQILKITERNKLLLKHTTLILKYDFYFKIELYSNIEIMFWHHFNFLFFFYFLMKL